MYIGLTQRALMKIGRSAFDLLCYLNFETEIDQWNGKKYTVIILARAFINKTCEIFTYKF